MLSKQQKNILKIEKTARTRQRKSTLMSLYRLYVKRELLALFQGIREGFLEKTVSKLMSKSSLGENMGRTFQVKMT